VSIRIICRDQSTIAAANVAGAQAEIAWRTFDIELPELEEWLRGPTDRSWSYTCREVIGAHLVPLVITNAEAPNA